MWHTRKIYETHVHTYHVVIGGIRFKSSDSGVVNITACIVGEGAMETYIFRHIYLIYTFELVEKSKHATTTN
jgi:hypothetical protein